MVRAKSTAFLLALQICGIAELVAAQVGISSFRGNGSLDWTNASVPGVCTVEWSGAPAGSWAPVTNTFAIGSSGAVTVGLPGSSGFFKVRSVDVSATAIGFTNLVYSYGLLETIAGSGGGQTDGVNYWQSWYEGWPATWAALSRPHFAMADGADNVYIADKNSHSILVVRPEGTIHTFAGTHVGGFNGEGPAPATTLELNGPNGEWVLPNGTVYVLDTDNGRVRRVNTNGIMATLFLATTDGSPISGGRGLWVKPDESLAYFCAGTKLKKWTPSAGVTTLASNFGELGNLFVETNGDILVCDRGSNRVYRVTPLGNLTPIAGSGLTTGGGDGLPALQTGLYGVRGIWPVPTGGYLLITHDGCQLWYMNAAGIIRLLLNGAGGRTHSGDGLFFYTPGLKIAEGRSVSMDSSGNILLCESDYGFIRRIRFLPLIP